MKYSFLILLLILIVAPEASSQIFRYRLCGNSTIFIAEQGKPEISHPDAEFMTYPDSREFTPALKIGAEAEISAPLTSYIELGLEFDYGNFYGHTETAPLYNYFLSGYNPLPDTYPYPREALIYKTKQLSVMGTSRLYFLPLKNQMNFFLKVFGGVAFTGTDLTFADPFYRVEYDVGVIYARGTLNSEYPKKAGFRGGAGLGFTYKVSDKFHVYLDGTTSIVHSDIVDGVPDYDYVVVTGIESLIPVNNWSTIAQVSVGLVYSAIPDRRLHRSHYTKSRNVRKKLFWKRKRANPFTKRRR